MSENASHHFKIPEWRLQRSCFVRHNNSPEHKDAASSSFPSSSSSSSPPAVTLLSSSRKQLCLFVWLKKCPVCLSACLSVSPTYTMLPVSTHRHQKMLDHHQIKPVDFIRNQRSWERTGSQTVLRIELTRCWFWSFHGSPHIRCENVERCRKWFLPQVLEKTKQLKFLTGTWPGVLGGLCVSGPLDLAPVKFWPKCTN